jgi:glutaconate CoA-transferase, subunit A
MWLTLDEMVASIERGSSVIAGGLPLWRKPLALIRAVVASGINELHYSAFLASLDAELLVAGGCLRELEYGYVGRDIFGSSPSLRRDESFERRTRTEFEYWAALRAAATNVATYPDAFGLAIPAKRYDLCILHATVADAEGNVYAEPLDVMEEDDRLLAQVADRVFITVERRVSVAPASAHLLIAATDVTALALAPRGAAPLGMAGCYPPASDELLHATARQ